MAKTASVLPRWARRWLVAMGVFSSCSGSADCSWHVNCRPGPQPCPSRALFGGVNLLTVAQD